MHLAAKRREYVGVGKLCCYATRRSAQEQQQQQPTIRQKGAGSDIRGREGTNQKANAGKIVSYLPHP